MVHRFRISREWTIYRGARRRKENRRLGPTGSPNRIAYPRLLTLRATLALQPRDHGGIRATVDVPPRLTRARPGWPQATPEGRGVEAGGLAGSGWAGRGTWGGHDASGGAGRCAACLNVRE